jgi:ABC-type sulfate transport system permease component
MSALITPFGALVFGLVVGWLLTREYYRSITK